MGTMPWVAVGLVLLVAVATGVIYTAFLVICAYKAIERTGVRIPIGIKRTAQVWFAIGLPADVIYNWTVGLVRFRELRGKTYSEHIQQRVDAGLWDDKTQEWALFLDAGAPNHIKRLPK